MELSMILIFRLAAEVFDGFNFFIIIVEYLPRVGVKIVGIVEGCWDAQNYSSLFCFLGETQWMKLFWLNSQMTKKSWIPLMSIYPVQTTMKKKKKQNMLSQKKNNSWMLQIYPCYLTMKGVYL